ncbi:hypothetical protein WDV85_03425 [Pseudokineococcus sp. 5B2Z-1]|uniref:hypothetical protein n=1 Tax=Pseudokineococcus sp. 5B2Z-1 TaxID=3132744 RepID=UPI0030A7DFF9
MPGARPMLLVLVLVVALQSTLRVAVSPPGTFRSPVVVAVAVLLAVAVPAVLVLASGRRVVRSRPAVTAAVSLLMGVDVAAVLQTRDSAVYGEGLFAATAVGLALLCLLAVRPLGDVVLVGVLHAVLLVGGSLLHTTSSAAQSVARGVEMAAVGSVPVAAWAAYLLMVARLEAARRGSEAELAREEAERRAATAAADEGAVRLATARAEVGPLLERVVAGAPVPLGPDDAATASAAGRRLRARLVRGAARSWLDDALAADAASAGAAADARAAVVVRADDGRGDLPVQQRGPLVALVRRARALGGDVHVVLLGGGAVVTVRGAAALAHDRLAADLLAGLGGPGRSAEWIAEPAPSAGRPGEGESLLVLEVGGDGEERP